ncbi:MAG: ATP-binding cassette, subfamily bacterial PglK [Actinomycetota bacterium]|nr:ATP-binding cassette, subfamily bacterial PglK [Actinomycetota bacterium]
MARRLTGPVAAARAVLRVVDDRARRRLLLGLVPSIALGLLEAVGVALVLPFVAALGPRDGRTPGSLGGGLRVGGATGSVPLWIGIAALGALLLRTAASAALTAWQLRVVARSERELTRRLLQTYLTQPWSFHRDRELAELTRNVRLNAWQLHTLMVTPVFTLPAELAVVVSVVVVLVVVNPLVAGAVALFFGVVAAIGDKVGGRRASQAGMDAQTSATELQRRVHDGLRAAKSLSVHGGGDVIAAGLEDALAASERARYHLSLAQYLPRYLLEATLAAGVGGLAVLVSTLSTADPVPTLALFATAGVRVMGPLSRLLTASSSLRSGMKVLEPVERDLALPRPAARRTERRPAPGHPPVVDLHAVSLTYPGAERPAVADVNLHIGAGELVALTGPSAAGKTTLVDVILGLLPPTAGSVVVDGVPVSESTLPAWSARLGYVPQDAVVLDDTVVHNVALGVAEDEIDEPGVIEALRDAELLTTVEALPGGLHQVLGDRDGRLSGGERQRLAIARALYRNPDMLVLDEPTSSLDPANETRLLRTIRALRGRRTVVIVTHRTSAAEQCDRIVALDRGRVVGDHRHERQPSASAPR